MAARVDGRQRTAAVGRPPAARLTAAALVCLAAAALAVAGFGRATLPRGDAGVSLAIGSSPGAVTVRNASPAAFRGSVVVGTGGATATIPVSLGAGQAADVPLPASIPCNGSLQVRLVFGAAPAGSADEMLRLPCGSATP